MRLADPRLADLLQFAYSAERAAALAYVGHAQAVRDAGQREAIRQIERDEWDHRAHVKRIMDRYGVPISWWYELRFLCIGKVISAACFVLGWFMPFYFAGRLESGNVCEYFRMLHRFRALGIHEHDELLYAMGVKEREHEDYFLAQVSGHPWLPFFQWWFAWGAGSRFNDVDLEHKPSVQDATKYCRK